MTELRTAACDHHLATALRHVVDKNKSRLLNVLHLDTPDPHYLCACQVPAHWYIRTVAVDPVRPGSAHCRTCGREIYPNDKYTTGWVHYSGNASCWPADSAGETSYAEPVPVP